MSNLAGKAGSAIPVVSEMCKESDRISLFAIMPFKYEKDKFSTLEYL